MVGSKGVVSPEKTVDIEMLPDVEALADAKCWWM